jgi:hypothetical protein
MAVNFTELISLMEAIPSVLTPMMAIIAIVIVIMAYMAVGNLIVGTIDGIVTGIREAMKFRRK